MTTVLPQPKFPSRAMFKRNIRGGIYFLSRAAGRILQFSNGKRPKGVKFFGWNQKAEFPARSNTLDPNSKPYMFKAYWLGRIEFRIWHPDWTALVCLKQK